MLRISVCLWQAGQVGGGRVTNISKYTASAKKAIKSTLEEGPINEEALQIKMNTLLARELQYQRGGEGEDHLEPPLPRKWVKAPRSSLSTATTRKDWFRLMSFNTMTDRWGAEPGTTPVSACKVRIPAFTRSKATTTEEEEEDDDASAMSFVDYDPAVDKTLPHFLTPTFRRDHLVRLIRCYDPDVVCLNEVNRSFFNDEIWKYVRFLGYGNLYQSSRGANVKALRKGDDPHHLRHQGKIPVEEDIGNVILFHKARFVPILMHGVDIGRSFHFVHFSSLRDKITNLNLLVACVQLTAGDTPEAAEVRLHEVKQILKMLEAMVKDDTDRAHTSIVICGDLNNQTEEEACVDWLRSRFFSTYDVVGGPRWTTWCYRDDTASERYQTYFEKNWEEMRKTNPAYRSEMEMQKVMRTNYLRQQHLQESTGPVPPALEKERPKRAWSWEKEDVAAAVPRKVESPSESTTSTTAESVDQLALIKEQQKAKGAIYQTQDFIFYQPYTLGLHQVLDVPEDTEVDPEQLFPNPKLPSHHLPLLIDVSFNNPHPDVLEYSRKE